MQAPELQREDKKRTSSYEDGRPRTATPIRSDRPGFNQMVVKFNKDKFTVTVMLRNNWDSAYNPTVTLKYSPNIILAAIEDKPKVSCESDTEFACKVGYPFLKREESITFMVTFQFNISHLLDTVSIFMTAVRIGQYLYDRSCSTSDYTASSDLLTLCVVTVKRRTSMITEKTFTFPVKYESWLTFTGSKKEFHVSFPANDSISAVINSTHAIGPEINLHYMIKRNDLIPMPRVTFRLSFRFKTPDGNILLYLTNVSSSDGALEVKSSSSLIHVVINQLIGFQKKK
ncbi:unnamed protein product, partial [Ranitomeya imitator]